MNNSKAPKIVIAVGLVSVFAAAFAYVMLRDKPEINVAQNAAVAPASQFVAAPAPIPASDPALAETSTDVAEPLPAMSEAPAPAASAPPKLSTRDPAINNDPAGAPPAAGVAAEAAAQSSAVEEPSVPSELASAGNDSQITADVRAQIEAVAPTGSIDVKTRDGVVELSGSVPSEVEADRVWLAARNVADVREVDVSALMISN